MHKYDVIDHKKVDWKTKKQKTVKVPILKVENFGENMAIDDKNIGSEGYTIISNKDTGKIAALIMSTKHEMIEKVLSNIPRIKRWNVATLSRDLAESYNWVSRTCFPNAVQIADKFHIIKLGLQALQDVRVRYRQTLLKEIADNKINGSFILENGDTFRQLLARSRYLLFSFESKWTESQKERARILFREFPEIHKAYKDICSFRAFYNTSIGNMNCAKDTLERWFQRMHSTKIPELKTFTKTIERNQISILEYFTKGHTNAFAESLNARIQRFVASNFGIRNRDFFHYRFNKIFS